MQTVRLSLAARPPRSTRCVTSTVGSAARSTPPARPDPHRVESARPCQSAPSARTPPRRRSGAGPRRTARIAANQGPKRTKTNKRPGAISATFCSSGLPEPGARPSYARRCGCARRWSISAPSGSSASNAVSHHGAKRASPPTPQPPATKPANHTPGRLPRGGPLRSRWILGHPATSAEWDEEWPARAGVARARAEARPRGVTTAGLRRGV
jgi:hypothetical protein